MVKLWLHAANGGGSGRDATALPTFYMNDWSELALRVSAAEPALDLLRSQGVGIEATSSGILLRFVSLDHIPHMLEQLKKAGLKVELVDRVNCGDRGDRVYQG